MRKSEENNKFRKKENAKKQYGSKSERLEKHICPPGECDLAKKMWRLPVSGNGL